ncbi:MAG: MBL fold metallo-hydrolase [Gammaproteobacteria bacterium]|nr:MBL fold metallo-hydrolase [Gammaproteobacteria bacterium]
MGDVKITRIVEGETRGPLFLLPDATKENIQAMPWLQPHFADAEGNCIISIHALILETPSKTIVVDTCLGNDKERTFEHWAHLQTKFIEDLTNAGYPPESVDMVLCTHLHTDHVGWNTKLVDGVWVPTFVNAEYLFGKTEWAYTEEQLSNPMYEEFIVDSIKPVIDAGLVRFVEVNEKICSEVRLEPTPGHTPGHISVHVESNGKHAVITGDMLHHPCQMEEPYWECSADWDTPTAQKTRVGQLGRFADEKILVFGTHFATPSAGTVVRKGKHFQFEV